MEIFYLLLRHLNALATTTTLNNKWIIIYFMRHFVLKQLNCHLLFIFLKVIFRIVQQNNYLFLLFYPLIFDFFNLKLFIQCVWLGVTRFCHTNNVIIMLAIWLNKLKNKKTTKRHFKHSDSFLFFISFLFCFFKPKLF